MRSSFTFRLHGLLLFGAAAALVLTTTTALAGSGVGGVFNLGQVNTVDAQTSLTGNPGGSPELKVTSTGTAAAVRGVAVNGIGTNGVSTSGVGQQGLSDSGIGTLGTHGNTTGASPGVQGETNSTDPNGAGVVGKNNGGGPGLKAIVNAGTPPLAVNSSVKVANLNADLLDGLDSPAFQKRVTGTCGAGSAIKVVNADGTVVCEPVGIAGAWGLAGNSGTTAGANFLGTTDSQPLELKVNGQRALRLEPNASGPNLVGGFFGNAVLAGASGATIAGGGASSPGPNLVSDDYGTIGGGFNNVAGDQDAGNDPTSAVDATVAGGADNTASDLASTVAGGSDNTASDDFSTVGGGGGNRAIAPSSTVGGGGQNTASGTLSTVPGGFTNTAAGFFSFAAGRRAKANHQGAFVWADSTNADFASTGADQFLVRASGGAKILKGTSSFHGTGAALQVEHAGTDGEAAWLRINDSASVASVLNLLKHPSGTGDFLECTNFDGTNTTRKCHIDQNGTYTAGSDFAESLPVRGGKARYQPGDVLSISRTHAGRVLKSHTAFDPALIGVYSTRPGVLGADKGGITRVGKNDIPVAITGIVPVKVTTQNGAIRPGDLLTSSGLPGRAMNAGRSPAVGIVLGKALGFLMRGSGTIRMLVMPR
jgi:hypothetical protein